VGKTALADELLPVVTGRDGWFVAGKFDAYRRDLEFDAAHQALRALGRLLLAEPEDELAAVRGRILAAAGPNAGLLTAVFPEFAALLAVPPDPGDPLTAQIRAQRAGAKVLRAVASRERPVVSQTAALPFPMSADTRTIQVSLLLPVDLGTAWPVVFRPTATPSH
jgi:predicted ATPase